MQVLRRAVLVYPSHRDGKVLRCLCGAGRHPELHGTEAFQCHSRCVLVPVLVILALATLLTGACSSTRQPWSREEEIALLPPRGELSYRDLDGATGAMEVLQTRFDIAAHNLANVETPAFKGTSPSRKRLPWTPAGTEGFTSWGRVWT